MSELANWFLVFLQTGWGELTAGVAIFTAVMVLFWKWDDAFSQDFKDDVALRLLCLEPPDAKTSWPDMFIRLFDAVFSKKEKEGQPTLPEWRKHLTWACFWRSCVASVVAVAVMFLVGETTGPLGRPGIMSQQSFILFIAMVGILLNFVPDYISLLQTRYLLRFLRGASTVKMVVVLAIDAVATLATFLVYYFFVFMAIVVVLWHAFGLPGAADQGLMSYMSEWIGALPRILPSMPQALRHQLWLVSGPVDPMGVFLYSTFFTSVWLWLFGLGQLFIRTARRMGPVLKVAKYVLPIEKRPFRSIGLVAATIAMVGYWGLAIVA